MKFDRVIDYIMYTDRWNDPKKPIKPLKDYIDSNLKRQDSLLYQALYSMPAKEKKEVILALISGDGQRIRTVFKQLGLHKLIIDRFNDQVNNNRDAYSDEALLRLPEHENIQDDYLDPTITKIIRVMIASFGETRAEFLKDVIKSCPETDLGLTAKKQILKQIDKTAAAAVTDVAFEPDVPNLSESFKYKTKKRQKESTSDKQSEETYVKVIEEQIKAVKPKIDESQFILLMLGLMKTRDPDNPVIHNIERNYLFLNYDVCIGLIENYLEKDKTFPLRSLILEKVMDLPRVNIEQNQPRRYFETKLAQYYLGTQLSDTSVKTSLNKFFRYYQKKYKIGVTFDDKDDPYSIFADWPDDKIVEKSIMSITDSEKVVGRLTRLEEHFLKSDSKKYKAKGREYAEGVMSRRDLSRHPDVDPSTYGESKKVLSQQVGLMKSSDVGYRDELSQHSTLNRSTDIHKYSKNEKSWPLQNPEVPYTASLSGHAYFIIGLLKQYMEDNKSDPDLEQDVNLFLMTVMMTYVKQGMHSFFEMLAVFEEKHVKKYFEKYNVDLARLRSLIQGYAVSNAIDYATQYALDLNLKNQLHAELLVKGQSVLKDSKSQYAIPRSKKTDQDEPSVKASSVVDKDTVENKHDKELKSNFIKELVAYRDRRLFQKKKESEPKSRLDLSTLFTSIKLHLSEFDADTKISAANKMIDLLQGKKLQHEFTDKELYALRQKKLGGIIAKYEKMQMLPKEFCLAEDEKNRRMLFQNIKL
jgi:hypothetical protein